MRAARRGHLVALPRPDRAERPAPRRGARPERPRLRVVPTPKEREESSSRSPSPDAPIRTVIDPREIYLA